MISLTLPKSPARARRARSVDGAVYMLFVLALAWYAAGVMKGAFPADLAAVYYAGHFFDAGAVDQIYWANPTTLPDSWKDAIAADGYSSHVYAFIYPPIWAALVAPLASWLTPDQFFQTFIVLHMFLFCATIRFMRDIFDHKVLLAAWALPVMLIAPLTLLGAALIALGQPTAILYFMVVLGLRHLVEGSHRRAAFWIALADTLKIFPVILGVIFLTRRFRSGLITFVITGLVMVALSFLFAPVSAHMAFVDIGRQLAAEANISYANLNFEAFLTRLHLLVQGAAMEGLFSVPGPSWVAAVNLLGAVGFAVWLYRSVMVAGPIELRQRVVPVSILVMTLLAPIAWNHYFAVTLAMLPGLFVVRTQRQAMLIVFAVVVINLPQAYRAIDVPWYPILATGSMIGLTLAFATGRTREQVAELR